MTQVGCFNTSRRSGVIEIFQGKIPQRTAGGRENQPPGTIGARALQALENGGMFAVHGQKGLIQPRRLLHYQVSPGHQRFLIGQQHPLAVIQGRPHGVQPRDTHDSAQRVLRAGFRQHPSRAVFAEDPPAEFHVLGDFPGFYLQRRHPRPEFTHQLKQLLRRSVSRQANGIKMIGIPARNVQRLRPDRARCAQNCNRSAHSFSCNFT